jgi:hypothetical protein
VKSPHIFIGWDSGNAKPPGLELVERLPFEIIARIPKLRREELSLKEMTLVEF